MIEFTTLPKQVSQAKIADLYRAVAHDEDVGFLQIVVRYALILQVGFRYFRAT